MAGEQDATQGSGTDAVMVYTTFPNETAAGEIAAKLVGSGLVACVNILPGVQSFYIWQGTLEREREVAAIMKTQRSRCEEVLAELRRLHPYENPAIVVLPIVAGSADYLAWIGGQTAGTGSSEAGGHAGP